MSLVRLDSGREKTKYLFIDGGYLRKIIEKFSRKYFAGVDIVINPGVLSHGYEKTFYYDCPPPRREGELEESHVERVKKQENFEKELLLSRGFHVFKGTTTSEGRRARQKQVDVAIAVDMLAHARRGNMEEVCLLSGDLDFKPLVDELVRDGMFVTIYSEPSSTSEELSLAVDARRSLTLRDIHRMATPEFRKSHPIPEILNQEKVKRGELIQQGVTADGESIFLYNEGSKHALVIPDPRDDKRETVCSFSDHEYLLFFFQEQHSKIKWADLK